MEQTSNLNKRRFGMRNWELTKMIVNKWIGWDKPKQNVSKTDIFYIYNGDQLKEVSSESKVEEKGINMIANQLSY